MKAAPDKIRKARPAAIVALLSATALTLSACGGSETDAGSDGETFNLRVGTIYGPDNWQTLGLTAYTDAVTEKSEGRITFEYFYQDTLVGVPEFPDALASGVLDLAPVLGVYTPELFPLDNWVSTIAFQSTDGPPAMVLQGSAATQEWALNEPGYTAEYESNGLHVIVPAALPHPKYDLICTDGPLVTLDDLRDRTVRISGGATASIAEALGMSPVSIPPAEIFDAMQRGVVECMMGPVIDFDSLGLIDIATHGAWLGVVGFSASTVMMSLDQWNELPEDLQTIMTESAPEFVATFAQGKLTGEAESNQKLEELGIQFDIPDQEVLDTIAAWEAEALDEAAASAPDSVSNPEESVQRYVELHQEWSDLVAAAGYEQYSSWTEWVEANPTGEVDLTAWLDLLSERVYNP